MKRITIIGVAALAIVLPTLTGCGNTKAQIAAHNLSMAAEQFQINRRIVFINGITDKYLFEVDGLCSVETANSALAGSLEVTCKVGPNLYKKSFLGLSDNVTYVVEQLDAAKVSASHYRMIFRPTTIIPDISNK